MQTDVFTLPTTATAADAMTLFATKGISGAPLVNEEGDLTGFVSDGDIMRNLADQIPSFKSAWSFIVERENADFEQTLSEVMKIPVAQMASKHVITVAVNDEMGEVARVLADNHLKKAPVMADARMVGIINRSSITTYAVSTFLKNEK